MKLRLRSLDEMRRVYFTRVSAQLVFVTSIKQQPLPHLATGHMKMTISLGPQGTLVTGTKTKPVIVKQYQRRVWRTCVSDVSTNGPRCGAHRSVLVTGLYGACHFVGMFVTGVPIEAYYSVVSVCNEL
jgi:hypothetical protein